MYLACCVTGYIKLMLYKDFRYVLYYIKNKIGYVIKKHCYMC